MYRITNSKLEHHQFTGVIMKISAKIKFILLNIIAAIILFIIIGIIVISSLDNYTKHGHSISVPIFYNLTPEEAEILARKDNLRVLVIDSLYNENAKPGTVLEQYPIAGSPVKDNRMIHLIINAQSPEKIIFPNLQNSAYRQTLQTLETRGFKIGQIEYAPSEFKNLVLNLTHNNRELTPGTLLPKGASVNIILGDGYDTENNIQVPVLTGKKLKDAISGALQAYMNIGKIIPDSSIQSKADQAAAIVYQQNPEPGNTVTAGTPVTLHITLKQDKVKTNIDSLIVEE